MRIRNSLLLSFGAIVLFASVARAQGPQLQLAQLDRLASQAAEVVNVTLDPALLQLAGGFLASSDPKAKEMISGLQGIQVKSFEFNREGVYSQADIDGVRSQLKTPWTRVVNVQSQKDGDLLEIYSWMENGRSGGILILAAEPKELTIVNIVGSINLAQLAALGGQFGVPQGLLPGAQK